MGSCALGIVFDGGRFVLSASPVSIKVTCIFSLLDVFMTTDIALTSLIV
jgi:hypothetical protein